MKTEVLRAIKTFIQNGRGKISKPEFAVHKQYFLILRDTSILIPQKKSSKHYLDNEWRQILTKSYFEWDARS